MNLSRHGRLGALGVASALATLAVTASACGGGSTASPTTSHVTTTTVVKYVHVDGKRIRVPLEPDGELPNPGVGTGDQVVITSSGPAPSHLFARVHQPIVFTNLTESPETITFQHFAVKSPSISPGKTWSWTPKTGVSIVYSDSQGGTGVLDIGELP